MDKELSDYIKKAQAQGLSREQIVGTLRQVGWEEEQIKQAFKGTGLYKEKISKKSSLPDIATVLALIFILIGGVAATALYNETWNPSWNPFAAKIENEEQISGEFANWQTYRNKEFGYEVRYPKDWVVDGGNNKKYFVSREAKEFEIENRLICSGEKEGICGPDMPNFGVYFNVEKNTERQTLSALLAYMRESPLILDEDIQEIERSGILGIRAQVPAVGAGLFTAFFKGNYFYEITSDGDEVIYDQILSTFKFIE